MGLNTYQELAQRTSNPALDLKGHLFNGVLGLAGEAVNWKYCPNCGAKLDGEADG